MNTLVNDLCEHVKWNCQYNVLIDNARQSLQVFTIPTKNIQKCHFLPHSCHYSIFKYFCLSHSKVKKIVYNYSFISHLEHLFMYLKAICIFSDLFCLPFAPFLEAYEFLTDLEELYAYRKISSLPVICMKYFLRMLLFLGLCLNLLFHGFWVLCHTSKNLLHSKVSKTISHLFFQYFNFFKIM